MATITTQPPDVELQKPELEAIGKDVAIVLQESQAITKIEDDLTYQKVATMGLNAAENIKSIEAILDPICDQRYIHWKRATSVRSERTAPFVAIKERCSILLGNYAEEKKKAAAKEDLRIRIEESKKAGAQNAAEAQQLFVEGREAEALALLERTVIPTVPVVVAPTLPKTKGVSTGRSKFIGRVMDFLALIKAIAAEQVPTTIVKLDQSKLNQLVNLDPKKKIPGVEVEEENKASFRV